MSQESTTITKEVVSQQELNDLLTLEGSILLPEEDKKPGFFKKENTDLSFVKPGAKTEEKKPENTVEDPNKEKKAEPAPSFQEALNEVEPVTEVEDTSKGRPKVSKDALIESTKRLIEKGSLIPFDEDKKIEDYTTADFEELYEANLRNKEEEVRTKVPLEFFDSLPEKLQYAAKYVADGGQDLPGLFRALAEVEEVSQLSDEVPEDQEAIAREYLTATKFGTPEDIAEEVNSWKDLGKLPEKAEKFKPRLEKMKSDQVAYRLSQEEARRKQREQAASQYQSSVYDTLKSGELNGIKLDKKTQESLYTGLVQPQYQSLSGRNTNELGFLLEKHQVIEPNLALVAELLWHARDPEGFKAKIKEQSKIETTENIVRKLKTEETKKIGSSSTSEKDEEPRRKLPRSSGFFKR